MLVAVVLLAAACRSSSSPSGGPVITALHPAQTFAGEKFQVQPDGQAAIAIAGMNFQKGAKILFNSRPLNTAFGNDGTVTASVPDELIAQPKTIQVRVENPDGAASDPVVFSVLTR